MRVLPRASADHAPGFVAVFSAASPFEAGVFDLLRTRRSRLELALEPPECGVAARRSSRSSSDRSRFNVINGAMSLRHSAGSREHALLGQTPSAASDRRCCRSQSPSGPSTRRPRSSPSWISARTPSPSSSSLDVTDRIREVRRDRESKGCRALSQRFNDGEAGPAVPPDPETCRRRGPGDRAEGLLTPDVHRASTTHRATPPTFANSASPVPADRRVDR